MRQTADFAEGNQVSQNGENQKPRFARQKQQNAGAQNKADQQVNQNRQGEFHGDNLAVFGGAASRINQMYFVNLTPSRSSFWASASDLASA
jgi:hypothetical protein